ncbi:hypothetical protein CBW65_09490 [Tumebacillus avium]|uniref:HNH endonuclease n=1 Tax=Tumebacillus avium TaxID=1903704 RepID=A0A1Y0IME4_9BACL|nr:hypothetical protein [Tumebacillus avium]ARU61219.1 hypothetical protein CBW65_09490 [Tumebacillus avium]
MIQIERTYLSKLAMQHYEKFFVGKGYAELLQALAKGEKDPLVKSFYEELNRRQIMLITGTPEELRHLLDDLFHRFPEVMERLVRSKANLHAVKQNLKKIKQKRYRAESNVRKRLGSGQEDSALERLENCRNALREAELAAEVAEHDVKIADLIRRQLAPVFDYGRFSALKEPGVGAYAFAEALQVNVCPYCNRQYTFTIMPQGDGRGMRPQVDHFYAKSLFPFLAVSFFNLIPCCSICNTVLKGTKDFYTTPHLNPYEGGFEQLLAFSVEFNADYAEEDWLKTWFVHNPEAFELKLRAVHGVDPEAVKKATENKETFLLEKIYNDCHKDYVSEMLISRYVYNDTMIKMLMDTFNDLFPSRESVLRLLAGNYLGLQDQGKRVLAKLTSDLVREFKI